MGSSALQKWNRVPKLCWKPFKLYQTQCLWKRNRWMKTIQILLIIPLQNPAQLPQAQVGMIWLQGFRTAFFLHWVFGSITCALSPPISFHLTYSMKLASQFEFWHGWKKGKNRLFRCGKEHVFEPKGRYNGMITFSYENGQWHISFFAGVVKKVILHV